MEQFNVFTNVATSLDGNTTAMVGVAILLLISYFVRDTSDNVEESDDTAGSDEHSSMATAVD